MRHNALFSVSYTPEFALDRYNGLLFFSVANKAEKLRPADGTYSAHCASPLLCDDLFGVQHDAFLQTLDAIRFRCRHGATSCPASALLRSLIAVPVAGAADEDRRDHEGADSADHAHDVGEDAVVGPVGDGFGLGL